MSAGETIAAPLTNSDTAPLPRDSPGCVSPRRLFYASFGFFYFAESENCILGIETFMHAVWFSVQSAATIGECRVPHSPHLTALFVRFST